MGIADLASRIDTEQLQLFIFGPGSGESVALRCPPGVWMVVDSCAGVEEESGTIPALELVTAIGEPVGIVVLTHPHADHAVGLDRILERFDPTWIGCVQHFIEPDATRSANNGRRYESEKVRPARAAIKHLWETKPICKWDIRAGDVKELGEASVEALHPTDNAIAAFAAREDANPNDLSTPMAVEWQEVRIVLGADLPNMYWGAAMDACTWNPAEHGALKVAHHGSKDAQYSDLIAAAETARSWVVTPWHSGRHLPNLADGHGPDLLLRSNPELLITSLTREASEFTSPVARTELEAAWVKIELANGKSTTRTRQPEIAESWVLASFTADGSAKIESGAETVTLVL